MDSAVSTQRPLRVALLGAGVVGGAVARLLTEHASDMAARVGAPLEIVGIAVRRAGRDRSDLGVDPSLFTTDADELVTRADVVVEVIGGIEPARSLILRAMKHGASVVTANKALLAEDGPALYAAAAEHGVDLYYEAAVAGAIPLLRPLRESLAGDDVTKVLGIVNGTTNYVLDKMDTTGAGFSDAVEQAQALGYAEADPTADVEGFDAAAKAAILASLAFHTRVSGADVYREGITEVTAADVAAAREMDSVVKLLAICERTEAGVSVRVHPAMIPRSHPLAGRPRGVQRRLRRGRRRRPADVLRPWRGRRPDRLRRARRPRRRRPAPGRWRPRPGREQLRRPARAHHGRRPDALPHQPRRRGPPGRPRPGRRGLRRPRRVDRDGAPAARPRRGRPTVTAPTSSSSRTRRPTPRCPPPSSACARLDVVRGVNSVMRVEGS